MRWQRFIVSRTSAVALLAIAPLVSLCLGLWAIAGGVYVVVLSPASDRLTAAERAFQSAKETQAQLLVARKNQEQLLQAKRQVDNAWRALPLQDQFSSLALAIAELGRFDRVSIPGMSYTVDQPKESSLPAKATISFQATGEYAAIFRFVQRLESADTYLVIESMDAARVMIDGKAGQTLVGLNIRVATFLRPNTPPARTLS